MNNDTNDVINEEVLDITHTTNSITSETKKDKKSSRTYSFFVVQCSCVVVYGRRDYGNN